MAPIDRPQLVSLGLRRPKAFPSGGAVRRVDGSRLYARFAAEWALGTEPLASGAGKAEPVRRALKDPIDIVATPIQLAREGVWFLDSAAAAAL